MSLSFNGIGPATAVLTLAATDKINQTVSDSTPEVVTAVSPAKVLVADNTSHGTYALSDAPYNGPAPGVSNQYVV